MYRVVEEQKESLATNFAYTRRDGSSINSQWHEPSQNCLNPCMLPKPCPKQRKRGVLPGLSSSGILAMASEAAAKPLVGKGACLTQMLRERERGTGVSRLVHSVHGRTCTYTGRNTVAGCRLPFKFAIPLSDCPPCVAPTVGQCTKRCSVLRLLEATSMFWAVSKSPIQAGCHSPLISDQVHIMHQVMDCSAAPDAVRCSGRQGRRSVLRAPVARV